MKSVGLRVTVEPQLKEELEAIAEREHRSVSNVIRMAIQAYVEAKQEAEAAA